MTMEKINKAISIAVAKIGVKELTGNNDGPFVDECLKLCGLDNQAYIKGQGKGKGYAWCASFLAYVLTKVGADIKPTAWAPSWFPAHKIVADKKGKPMDVFGINYGGYENGHVGFILCWPDEGDSFISIEGNWGGQVALNIRKKSEVNSISRWI